MLFVYQQTQWRVTTKPGKLYFTFFDEPRAPFALPAMKNTITRAYRLADKAPVEMKTENGRTFLNLERPILDPMATVVVVEFEGSTRVNANPMDPDPMTLQQIAKDTCIVRNTAGRKGRTLADRARRHASRYLHYGRIVLDAGDAPIRFDTNELETGLVCLKGSATVTRERRGVHARPLRLALRAARRVDRGDAGRRRLRPRGDRRAGRPSSIRCSSCRSPTCRRIPGCTSTPARTTNQREVNILIGKNVEAGRIMAGVTFSAPGNWTSWPPHEHAAMLEEAYLYIDMPAPAFGLQLVYTDAQRAGDRDDRPRRRRRADAAGLSPERRRAGRLDQLPLDDGGQPRARGSPVRRRQRAAGVRAEIVGSTMNRRDFLAAPLLAVEPRRAFAGPRRSPGDAAPSPPRADEGRHAARRLRRDPARAGRVRREQHLQPACRRRQLDEEWSVDGAVAAPRARRVVRHLARHGAAADELDRRSRAPRCRAIYARQEPGARPRDRRHLPDDPQLRARRHSMQVKYNLTLLGVSAHRHRAGPRRRALQHVRLRRARSRIRR